MASASFASSSIARRNYDVFLSFRGLDSRNTIISHLYYALLQKGVFVFKDSEELETGRKRSELFDAIEGSRTAIVVFSKNYADSKWCLDELQMIMECKEQGKLTVLPMFYHVSPREVRLHAKDKGGKGCYQEVMEEMEKRYGKDSEMIRGWRKALYQGGDLIGISVDERSDEGSVIREIVEKFLKLLNRVRIEVAKYPVGIDRHLVAIRPLLHISPDLNDVRVVGLLGQGGAGKTTLAKAIYNGIANLFDSCCFLPNVRETTSTGINGLAQLQETLLRVLLADKDIKVWSVDEGKELIKQRLCNKRVLVILDDVDSSNQIDALAGNATWFGKGSRILITTRDEHVLASIASFVYRVELLGEEEARSLFLLHAFKSKQEEEKIDSVLIDSMVEYSAGLPLALVVLGAYLRGRSQSEWEEKRKDLNKSPDRTINSVLKISYDGLEDDHKEIYLDVACFYRGWRRDHVEKILNSCGYAAASLGITILVERCLVTVVDEAIAMHDLLSALGQSISRDDCLKRNEVPSRIWLYDDFVGILSTAKERQAVKGIMVNCSNQSIDKSIELKSFENCKVLILWNLLYDIEPVCLPRELRWLEWTGYCSSSIEFEPSSKLVYLDLRRSGLEQINGKGFKDLMYVDLSGCHSLTKLPDLSNCSKLEELNLRGCTRLSVVPSSLTSKHLRRLDFGRCRNLQKLPDIMEENKFLEELDASMTAIKELPASFCTLTALKILMLWSCREPTTIPTSIYKMRALEVFHLRNCPKLSEFPRKEASNVIGCPNLVRFYIDRCNLTDLEFLNDLTCFETLKFLNLSKNGFSQVPACISKFNNLERLLITGCQRLRQVSELPNVSRLDASRCRRLTTLPSLHTFICQSPKVFWVNLSSCHSLDGGYLSTSLPLEAVRGFVGEADVLVPGNEFPLWVTFQTSQCDSLYRVSLPRNMSEDDILGFALFVTLHLPEGPKDDTTVHFITDSAFLIVGGSRFERPLSDFDGGVHSWFVFIPRRSTYDIDFAANLNWHELTMDFSMMGVGKLQKWGMRLLCKQEKDDHRIRVLKEEEEDDNHSSGSEYESALDCDCNTDYESAQSEW